MPGGVTLVFIHTGRERARAALARLHASGARPRPVLAQIGRYLQASTQDRFRRETGPEGPWPPSIRAREKGGQTLPATARLRRSIVWAANDREVVVGTNVRYAATHQYGADIEAQNAPRLRFRLPGVGWVSPRRVRIPARPFLGLDDHDEGAIERIVGRYLGAAVQGAPA